MKTRVFALMLCITTLGLATSCSKENKDDKDLIIGTWEITDGTRTIDGEESGYKDQGMIIGFLENGDYSVNGTIRGTWKRSNDETIQIKRTNSNEWEVEKILSLTQETLKIKKEYDYDGHSYVDIETLKRK